MAESHSTEERFWAKVQRGDPGDCWLWLGSKDPKGYGLLSPGPRDAKRTKKAHRIAWYLHSGEMPSPDIYVCHRCDNPSCVNPAHLFLGTHVENMLDMVAKGRMAQQRNSAKQARGSRSGPAKLTEAQAAEILRSAESAKVLARRYGVSSDAILYLRSGKSWKHVAAAIRGASPTPEE